MSIRRRPDRRTDTARSAVVIARHGADGRPTRSMNMAAIKQKISTFLWFDNNAEEAANHYVSIFKNSKY
jgi:hypothetical protein